MNVTVDQIAALQADPTKIRNICILAHVDHGKTTLSDSLIASNGLIHPKMAGKLRYLDSREDEQERCITMKSSSISLVYAGQEDGTRPDTLVNLIDSPGHIDFCSEVSTAVRLSDGCLVLVDSVEGVCIQTHAVLRQMWEEKLTPCLIFNKFDRLVLELQLSPEEAYQKLRSMLAEVNSIISAFESERYLSEADAVLAHAEAAEAEREAGGHGDGEAGGAEMPDLDESTEDMFSCVKGNVAFASGVDGWAFRVEQFSSLYAKKLGCNEGALCKALWGDYYFQPKTKKIVGKKAAGGKLKPLFVQFCLDPIYKAYSIMDSGGSHGEALSKMATSLGLAVAARDLGHGDSRVAVASFLRAWLPLAGAVLGMAATCLPSPLASAKERAARLVPVVPLAAPLAPRHQEMLARARAALESCDLSTSHDTVAFISKMVAVPASTLPRGPRGEISDVARRAVEAGGPQGHVFLGFGRVFAGTLTAGQRIHVLSSAYDPSDPRQQRQTAVAEELYLMMGQGLERLDRVPAGNVFAVAGLETAVLKSATLASTPVCRPFGHLKFQAAAIVRVAVETADPSDMPKLVEGLRLLNRADPMVEVAVQESGEHVLGAAGEVHLETCVKDLRERFARVQLQVSAPLVAFRETVVDPSDAPAEGPGAPTAAQAAGEARAEVRTPNGLCTVRARAIPMPMPLAAVMDECAPLLKRVMEGSVAVGGAASVPAPPASPGSSSGAGGDDGGADPASEVRRRLGSVLDEAERDGKPWGRKWRGILSGAWSLGPRRLGANVLVASAGEWSGPEAGPPGEDGAPGPPPPSRPLLLGRPHVAQLLGMAGADDAAAGGDGAEGGDGVWAQVRGSVESGVATGHQLAAANGPLCDEPLWATAIEVDAVIHVEEGGEVDPEQLGSLSGQVISTAREACRRAVTAAGARLAEAMYLCESATTAEALGSVYASLGKRRARVLREEMREGSGLFSVHAYLPVAESFGFADELRRSSSGAASASLMLSHWERVQVDPFFIPTTQEEREEFGEEGQGVGAPNLARRLSDSVRRRKGLPVKEKVVKIATKQRTQARKV